MLDFLRGKRATVSTAKQLGEPPEFLSRVLKHDPEAFLTPGETERILAAYEATKGCASAVVPRGAVSPEAPSVPARALGMTTAERIAR